MKYLDVVTFASVGGVEFPGQQLSPIRMIMIMIVGQKYKSIIHKIIQ